MFVGSLLAAVAGFILVAFVMLERGLREKLENFGLNTLIVREMIMVNDPELVPQGNRPDRLAQLVAWGDKLRLRQLYVRATSEWPGEMQVISYPPEAMPWLRDYASEVTPLICVSDQWPENAVIKVSANRQTGQAIVKRPGKLFRPLANQNLLLAPQGWIPDIERIGFVEINLFQRRNDAPQMKSIVDMIQLLFNLDKRTVPQVQSPLQMAEELEDLREKQKQWRAGLAATLGLALALVYGAIAVLEFRQNLFISALLRSMGAPGAILFLRQWGENALLANMATAGAIALLAVFHDALFTTLGISKSVLAAGGPNPYFTAEVLMIFVWVNVGALLSALPVAFGMRRPVGEVLN